MSTRCPARSRVRPM